MNHWNDRSLNGCMLETELVATGHVVPTINFNDLPRQVDLRQWCSSIEDQKQTYSCTANAIVGALEYHQRRLGLPVTDLSRLFVYYNARKLANAQHVDCGSYIHHVMAAVLAYGVCEERIWPFHPDLCVTEPSQEAYANATQHQAVQYGRTPLGPSAIYTVASGIPVVFATYVPARFYYHATQHGVMPLPADQIEPMGSGHAMVLVGYDIDERVWIVRNSHGVQFGENGYTRIPFETLAAYSIPEHFWSIGAIDKAPGLEFSDQPMDVSDLDTPSHLRIDLTKSREKFRRQLENNVATASQRFRNSLRS